MQMYQWKNTAFEKKWWLWSSAELVAVAAKKWQGEKYGFAHNGSGKRKISDAFMDEVAHELIPHAKSRRMPNYDCLYHTLRGVKERHNEGFDK